MKMSLVWSAFTKAALVLVLAACATSPTGRSQLQLFPDAQVGQMGFEAYQQVRKTTRIDTSKVLNKYVGCVVHALTTVTGKPLGGGEWTVTVFKEDKTVNAFALPGGNIGIYSGLLAVADTPDELATVVGHEIAHVQAGHGNERMSNQFAAQTGLQLVGALAGADQANPRDRQLMALLGLGVQVGVLLPFSRVQESEADQLGMIYMANAGFDPHAAIQLWRDMTAKDGAAPPEWLSTHPSDQRRIRDLQADLPRALGLYETARAQGRVPRCKAPSPRS